MKTPSLSVAIQRWLGYGQPRRLSLMRPVSIAQEDKMTVRQQYTPEYPVQLQSWKEIVELYHSELIQNYPEGLWVDSGEVDYDSKES